MSGGNRWKSVVGMTASMCVAGLVIALLPGPVATADEPSLWVTARTSRASYSAAPTPCERDGDSCRGAGGEASILAGTVTSNLDTPAARLELSVFLRDAGGNLTPHTPEGATMTAAIPSGLVRSGARLALPAFEVPEGTEVCVYADLFVGGRNVTNSQQKLGDRSCS